MIHLTGSSGKNGTYAVLPQLIFTITILTSVIVPQHDFHLSTEIYRHICVCIDDIDL